MTEFENRKFNIKLEDIKSSYITKQIFSFLREKKKLNIIIYNKELQKKFLINIEDYKNISGRYKKGEKNGKEKNIMMIVK